MESINFKSLDDFGNKLLKEYDYHSKEEFYSIGIVAHYNIMIDVLNWLVKNSNLSLYDVSISPSDSNGYYDEYLMIIDSEGYIWIEQAKNEKNEYLTFQNNIIFVHSDVSSKFLRPNKIFNIIEFDINGEGWDDENNKKEAVIFSKDEYESMHGFTATRSDGNHCFSYSFFCSDEIDVNTIKNLLSQFGFSN